MKCLFNSSMFLITSFFYIATESKQHLPRKTPIKMQMKTLQKLSVNATKNTIS